MGMAGDVVILFDTHGKVRGVYEHRAAANLDNDTYLDGRGFTVTVVVNRFNTEPLTH